MILGEAFIDVRADTDDFSRDTESKIGSIAKKAAALFAGAFVLDKAKEFIGDSIGLASDLNETLNKSNTIFGKQAAQIDKWSQTAATSLGLSREKALAAAASFGDMFLQIGFTGDAAAKMSKATVQMSADLGSFNNLPTADVQQRIAAAFRGEYDSLQAVIPNINAARVESEALAATGKKTAKELTAQEKATAVLAIVTKDGARAQGDFAKTSGGLANQQKILSARMEDLKAKVGTALLPIMTKLTTLLSNLLAPTLEWITGAFHQLSAIISRGDFVGGGPFAEDSKFIDVVFKIRDGVTTVIEYVKDLFNLLFKGDFTGLGPFQEDSSFVAGLFKVREVMMKIADFVSAHLKPILIGLGVVVLSLMSPILAAVIWWGALTAAVVYAYNRFEIFRNIVNTVGSTVARFTAEFIKQMSNAVRWVTENWAQISEAVGHVMVAVETVTRVVLGVLQTIWRAVGDDIFSYVERVFHAIYGVINAVLDVIRGIIQTVLALINGDWGRAWDGIKDIVRGVWDGLYAIVAGALGAIVSILGAAVSLLWEGGRRLFGVLVDAAEWAVRAVVDFHLSLPGRIVAALGNIGEALVGLGRDLMTGFGRGVAELWGSVVAFFKDLPGAVGRAIVSTGRLADMLYGIGWDLIFGFGRGVRDLWVSAWQFFRDLPGAVLGVIGDVSKTLWGVGRSIIEGLGKGIKSAANLLVNAVLDALGPLAGIARKVFGISSPSKVFMDIGQNLIAGLAVGLSDTRAVDRAMAGLMPAGGFNANLNVAAGVVGRVGGAFATGNQGARLAPSISVVVNATDLVSAKQAADIAVDEIVSALEDIDRQVTARGARR